MCLLSTCQSFLISVIGSQSREVWISHNRINDNHLCYVILVVCAGGGGGGVGGMKGESGW